MVQTLVINEKKFIEDIIETSVVPDDMTANMIVMYLTKYYYNTNISLDEIVSLICEQMKKFNFDITKYQEYNTVPRIKKIFHNLKENKLPLLRTQEFIPIYQSEYDKIMSCETDKEKKVLFTLYVLAKYTNKYGWVYNEECDIYKLANTTKSKVDVIALLIKNKLVKSTKKVNDLKVGVDLSDGNEDVVFKVYEIHHLGNQLLSHLKDGYICCEKCGKLIKITGKNHHYCNSCSLDMRLETKKKWWNNQEKIV